MRRRDSEYTDGLAVVFYLERVVAHLRHLPAPLGNRHIERRYRIGEILRQLRYLFVNFAPKTLNRQFLWIVSNYREQCITDHSLPDVIINFLQYERLDTVENEGAYGVDDSLEHGAQETQILEVHIYVLERQVHVDVLSLQLPVGTDFEPRYALNDHPRQFDGEVAGRSRQPGR